MPNPAGPFRRVRVTHVTALALIGAGLFLALVPGAAAQIPDELTSTPVPPGEGWIGFTNLPFLLEAFLNLTLAAVLGAVIGFHPRRLHTADTLAEIEAPKVSIVYSVIGSLIGILVVEYGLVVGFVLFGIGGLIRFRSAMRSAPLTGQVIFVTLVGLTCGLQLPHVAALAAAFDFVMTYILEARVTYRVEVRALRQETFAASADAYHSTLVDSGFKVLSEDKRPDKARVCFIFRCSGRDPRERIQSILDERVAPELRGILNWEID